MLTRNCKQCIWFLLVGIPKFWKGTAEVCDTTFYNGLLLRGWVSKSHPTIQRRPRKYTPLQNNMEPTGRANKGSIPFFFFFYYINLNRTFAQSTTPLHSWSTASFLQLTRKNPHGQFLILHWLHTVESHHRITVHRPERIHLHTTLFQNLFNCLSVTPRLSSVHKCRDQYLP